MYMKEELKALLVDISMMAMTKSCLIIGHLEAVPHLWSLLNFQRKGKEKKKEKEGKEKKRRKEKECPRFEDKPHCCSGPGADMLTVIGELVQGALGKKSPHYNSVSAQSCCSVQSSTPCVLYFVNIRHFVWPLLLFALFLSIIFDFLLLLYQLWLLCVWNFRSAFESEAKCKVELFFSLADTKTMNMDQNFHFLFLPYPFAW